LAAQNGISNILVTETATGQAWGGLIRAFELD
jgi:hypothetical protein